MNIARPRLLVASLAIALVVSIVGAIAWANAFGDDDGGEPDAVLTDPQGVVTFPADGLGNDAVEGDTLPAASVFDADENEISTAEFLGDPLVMNFWFSTCAPCAKELPDFAEVHAERGDEVRFIGINTVDTVDAMERFAGERGVQYELYRDTFAELTDGIGAVSFPVTIFVTSDGTIVEQTGVLDADQLREKVDELMAVETA